jgi:hypothetical protein
MFKLEKKRNRLYMLTFDSKYELGMTFLRYEEYYESPRFRGKPFRLSEMMSWYTHKFNHGKSFSYPDDYSGYNMPLKVVREVQKLGIADPNHYDALMDGITGMIEAEAEDAYLIGAKTGAEDVVRHEIAHGLYYTNEGYRTRVELLYKEHLEPDKKAVETLRERLVERGYHEGVFLDEMHAYAVDGPDLYKGIRSKGSKTFRTEVTKLYESIL